MHLTLALLPLPKSVAYFLNRDFPVRTEMDNIFFGAKQSPVPYFNYFSLTWLELCHIYNYFASLALEKELEKETKRRHSPPLIFFLPSQ